MRPLECRAGRLGVPRLLSVHQVKGVSPAASPEQQEALLEAAAPFQNAYLAGSLQRMSDAVGAAFPGGNRALPTAADLQKCIGCASSALRNHHRTCICPSSVW